MQKYSRENNILLYACYKNESAHDDDDAATHVLLRHTLAHKLCKKLFGLKSN